MRYFTKVRFSITGIFLLCVFLSNSKAQDAFTIDNILRVDIITPGLGGEVAMGDKQTFEGSVNLGFAFGFTTYNGNREGYFLVAPTAHGQFRFYFNQQKRLDKGKSIHANSGLFGGFHFGYSAPDIFTSNSNYFATHGIIAGPVFGVQRTFDSNVQVGFNFGLGVKWDNYNGAGIGSPGTFHISYVIRPKKAVKIKLD